MLTTFSFLVLTAYSFRGKVFDEAIRTALRSPKAEPKKKPSQPEKRAASDIKWVGYVMSEDEADSLKAKRKEMEQREADVAKVEELANDLEARLYSITEKLDDGVWAEVTSEEQREELKKAVADGKEFP